MRLDEAVKVFLEGKKVEWVSSGGIFTFGKSDGGSQMTLFSPSNVNQYFWPIDGWRLALNPMQAWERMKAGKVVRSDKSGLRYKFDGHNVYSSLGAYDWDNPILFQKFMDATDLYEVEDE